MNTKYIIVCGNPIAGLEFYGPFDTIEEATTFVNNDPHLPNEWWTASLLSVEEQDNACP
jgi:hypothetical protein